MFFVIIGLCVFASHLSMMDVDFSTSNGLLDLPVEIILFLSVCWFSKTVEIFLDFRSSYIRSFIKVHAYLWG